MTDLLMNLLMAVVIVCAVVILYGVIMGHESVYWKDEDD